MDSHTIYNKIKEILPKDKIDALYLFGSYANVTFTDESDIDLAIFSEDIDLVLPEKNNVCY